MDYDGYGPASKLNRIMQKYETVFEQTLTGRGWFRAEVYYTIYDHVKSSI